MFSNLKNYTRPLLQAFYYFDEVIYNLQIVAPGNFYNLTPRISLIFFLYLIIHKIILYSSFEFQMATPNVALYGSVVQFGSKLFCLKFTID